MTNLSHTEITHRQLCDGVTRWFLNQAWCAAAVSELTTRVGTLDACAAGRPDRDAKIAAVEVKRTRSDLLQDLRKRKMHKYEDIASHMYLAATAAALGLPDEGPVKETLIPDAVADLRDRGLPDTWGILLLRPCAGDGAVFVDVHSLRASRKIQDCSLEAAAMTAKIARSLSWRVLCLPG